MSAIATVTQERLFFIRQRKQRGSGCEACGHSGLIDGYACLMCREDDNPAQQKRRCGECHSCRTRNPFGCSRDADQSQIDAVVAMAD